MKKESRRDNLLLASSARKSLEGPSSLPSISSDDVDFQDVFGGPPRRFSLHETTRYSSDGVEVTARSCSWSNEKPVFGGGSSIDRGRHQNHDFFHDIFQGVKSRSSSGSVIMRQYDTSGTSLPAQPSLLSTTSAKAVDNPTFASTKTSNMKEDRSYGISLSNYSLSRFSNQARRGHDFTSNVRPSNGPRPSSNEISHRNKESSYVAKSDETGLMQDPKRDSDVTKAQTDIEHSHFSMYKWAGTEAPLDLEDEVGSDVVEKNNLNRWSNSDRRVRNNKDSDDIDNSYLPEKTRREASTVTEKDSKPVPKTLHSFLHDDIRVEDDVDITMKTGEKVNAVKTTKTKSSKLGTSKHVKKSDEEETDLDSTEVDKGSTRRSSNIAEENVKRNGVGRKVKNFVRMFNEETYLKPKSNHGCQGQSFRSQGKGTRGENDESNLSTSKSDAVMHFSNLNTMLDALAELNENVEQLERNHSHVNSPFFTTTDSSSIEKEASPCSESIPDYSEVRSDRMDNHFQEKYTIQELIGDQVELLPTSEYHKAIKVIDDKILKWSTGKEGNIRSLISTLQYVLWAESGWKPVPLVNIIELNAVKKSYQKALLCLHPDKLQQKGADFHQAYTAEKVFDILQEAWDHFNSFDPFGN